MICLLTLNPKPNKNSLYQSDVILKKHENHDLFCNVYIDKINSINKFTLQI